MSSSEASSKIDILDTPEEVEMKIKGAFCEAGSAEGNGVLSFCKMVLFQVTKGPFEIKRPAKYGGDVSFANYAELEAAFVANKLDPVDLKAGVTKALNKLLEPIRKKFDCPKLQELTAAAYPEEHKATLARRAELAAKAQPAGKKGKKGPPPKKVELQEVAKLELRIGLIKSVKKHADADTLFVEEIDVGEAKPRQIVSGLVKYYKEEELVNRKVIVACNLKASKLVGVESAGMVMAASADGKVDLLTPPAGAKVGERVTFEGFPQDVEEVPRCNDKQLKNIKPNLKTDANGNASYKGVQMKTSAGVVTASLPDALIV